MFEKTKKCAFLHSFFLVPICIVAVFIFFQCSAPGSPAPDGGWTSYSNPQFGYGIMIPSQWQAKVPPGTGQVATMTVMNYDDANVIQTGIPEAEWPEGTLKIDIVTIEDNDPTLEFSDAMKGYFLHDPYVLSDVTMNGKIGASDAYTIFFVNSNDSSDTIKALGTRFSENRIILIFLCPERAWAYPGVQEIIDSITLSQDTKMETPSASFYAVNGDLFNQVVKKKSEEAPLTRDTGDEVGDSPITPLFMPFLDGTTWTVGGIGSFYGDYAHSDANNDYYGTDWNKGNHGAYEEDLGQYLFPVAPGKILDVGYLPKGYGNYIKIDHGQGVTTLYGHLLTVNYGKNDVGIDVGINDILGTVGSSGNSSGPHLHLSFRVNGVSKYNTAPSRRPSPMWTTGGFWKLRDYESATVTTDMGTTTESPTATPTNTPVVTPTGTTGVTPTPTTTPVAGVPAIPSNQSAVVVDDTSIRVSWSDNSGNETGFRITNGVTSAIVSANTTSYVWGGLAGGTYMCFAIQSYNAAGTSDWTPYACTTTPSTLPKAVADILKIIFDNNIYTRTDKNANRNVLREPLKNLTLVEASQLMKEIRKQNHVDDLINALINIDGTVANPTDLKSKWHDILMSGTLDYSVEILTYTLYKQEPGGYFCENNTVKIDNYSTVPTGTIIHESHHSFNYTHGLSGVNGLNEGTAITVIDFFDGSKDYRALKNLGESVFGTVLFYRDIGIPGYPKDIPIGDANVYDAKGKLFLRFLMSADQTTIDWLTSSEVTTVYNLYWKSINRNVDWETWLQAVAIATTNTRNYLHPSPITPAPTATQTAVPTAVPTGIPTGAPTAIPTSGPTAAPTVQPTPNPTVAPTTAPTPVPPSVIIIDDGDSGFSLYGNSAWWYRVTSGTYYWNGDMYYTYVNGSVVSNSAEWRPNLPVAGTYKVEAWITWDHATTTWAPYTIYHAGSSSLTHVNQAIRSEEWADLGTYYFDAGTGGYVLITDATGENANASPLIELGVDAVRWTRQ